MGELFHFLNKQNNEPYLKIEGGVSDALQSIWELGYIKYFPDRVHTIAAASSKLSIGRILTELMPIRALASFTLVPEENLI